MINRILAEYLSFETPEQRTKNIYETIIAYFEKTGAFQKFAQQQANSLTICSALSFKYNPTVNYRVKVYKLYNDIVGEIKLCFRTQNKQLVHHLSNFYEMWIDIEESNPYTNKECENAVSVAEDGKLTKYIAADGEDADLKLSLNIAAYIEMTHTALNVFINERNNAGIKNKLEDIQRKFSAK
jgi:hypothetical protein